MGRKAPCRRVIAVAVLTITLASALACVRSRPSPAARKAAADEAFSEGERRLALDRRGEASHFLFRALAGYRDASELRGEVASLVALGRLRRREERNDLALDFFARAMALATDGGVRSRVAALYGETLVALGRNEAAVQVLADVLRRTPDGVEAAQVWLHLARAEKALGRLRRSRTAAEKAVALGSASVGQRLLVDVLVDLGELERAFELSQGVSLAWVQRALLDPETRVLAYVLGEGRSLLWDVTATRLRAHALADGSFLESVSQEARRELARGEKRGTRVRGQLSAELLGRVALSSDDRRLVVVSSGELASVPFGALFVNGAPLPLVTRVEIIRVRSLSTLRLLRARAGRSYVRWVAVAADPTYGLSGARREARAIARLGPPGRVSIVEGSQAASDVVLGDVFGRSRILHLATHGVDGRGLVLSDATVGRAELQRTEVLAETVVLSACATDLTEVLLGRGARRVVASHWRVDDEATAELMVRFYAGVFSGASPAAALRQAQVALWRRSRFSAPRYWAAFELHGDWTI